ESLRKPGRRARRGLEDRHHVPAARLDTAPDTNGRTAREDIVNGLYPAVPVETAVLPVAAAILVGDFDRGDPFRVLEPGLGRGAQPQREAERVGDRLASILRRQDGLRMQRARHVDAAVVVVGALECDVACLQVGANALEKLAQVRAGPLPDIVPTLDADMP